MALYEKDLRVQSQSWREAPRAPQPVGRERDWSVDNNLIVRTLYQDFLTGLPLSAGKETKIFWSM